MRNIDTYIGSLLWIAVATLLPMAALTPVTAGRPEAVTQAHAAALCADAPARPGGCESGRL